MFNPPKEHTLAAAKRCWASSESDFRRFLEELCHLHYRQGVSDCKAAIYTYIENVED